MESLQPFGRHIAVLSVVACLVAWSSASPCKADLAYTVNQVWSDGQYNAFTDLTRFNDRWYMAFREASVHGIPPVGEAGGAIRILESVDGAAWNSVSVLSQDGIDLRDPKLIVTPDDRLMLMTGARPQDSRPMTTCVSFSDNGSGWSVPQSVSPDSDYWLWGGDWHNNTFYCVGYGPASASGTLTSTRLYSSSDGLNFQTLVSPMVSSPIYNVSESSLEFLHDGRAVTLVRRTDTSLIGISSGDYTNWTYVDAGMRLYGAELLELPDGRIVAGGRVFESDGLHTSLCWLDADAGSLTPFLELPSGPGDTGYPGIVWDDGKLWVSYYSAGAVGSDIYLAEVDMPVAEPSTLILVLLALPALVVGRRCLRR
jgi:hypothetical protein